MITYVAPPSMGLGDLVITLPVVQALVEQKGRVRLVLRCADHQPLITRIGGLEGYVFDWQLDAAVGESDVLLDLRDHNLQRTAWWGSPEFSTMYPDWTINDILETICQDKSVPVNVAQWTPLPASIRHLLSRSVAFVPGSAVSSKCWHKESWLELSRLLKEGGYESIIVGQPAASAQVGELISSGLRWEVTQSVTDALDVLSSCAAVVSVDTGLMHLAVHQGTPTVGLFKQNAVYARPAGNFVAEIAGRQCASACLEQQRCCADLMRPSAGPEFIAADWQCQAPYAMNCLSSITPDNVYKSLAQLIPNLVPAAVTTLCGRRRQRTGIRQ